MLEININIVWFDDAAKQHVRQKYSVKWSSAIDFPFSRVLDVLKILHPQENNIFEFWVNNSF